jgi:UvrD-like helicase C-terminal domain
MRLGIKAHRMGSHRGRRRCAGDLFIPRSDGTDILDFPNQFSPPANIITLDRNYRSTQNILAAANGVIGLAAERFTKNLWTDRTSGTKPQLVSVRDEADQARFIVERVLERVSVRLIMCTGGHGAGRGLASDDGAKTIALDDGDRHRAGCRETRSWIARSRSLIMPCQACAEATAADNPSSSDSN